MYTLRSFSRVWVQFIQWNPTHSTIGLCFLFVAHGHDSQHQIDEVERAKEHNNGKKDHMDGSTGCHDLKHMGKQTVFGTFPKSHETIKCTMNIADLHRLCPWPWKITKIWREHTKSHIAIMGGVIAKCDYKERQSAQLSFLHNAHAWAFILSFVRWTLQPN